LKKVLVGLAGLVAVLIVTVLVAPSFIDWTSYRNGIAAEIERVLGRRVVIDGAVEASIVPTPRLSLHGLRLGNLTGASSPYMAQVEALEVRVAFWPLLSGKIVVTSVALRKPVVELELLPDGQRNWVFGRSIEDVQFENATITDGTVIYRETRSGAEERVEGINARLAADGFYGPLRAAGELRYEAIPLRFSLSTGRFDPRGQAVTPVNLTAEVLGPPRGLVRAQAVRATGSFIGTVRLPEAASPQIDGQLKLRGDDLADVVATLGVGSDVPDVLAQPFSLESALDLKDKMLTANGVSLQLGETRAQGAVNAAFTGDEPQIDVALTLGRIDLDAWLAAAAKKAASRPAEENNGPGEPEDFELPVNVRLTLDVTADALTHRSGAARQIKLAAEMGDGVVDIYQFSVQLPGGTDASFNGKLLAVDGRPRVNGLAEIASDDFRSLLAWLDMDISGLPPGRLNKVAVTGHLGATAEMLEIGELDLRFDNTRVTGALVGALRERPAFGVNLIVDQFNLDSYLPGASAAGAEMTAAAAAGALPLTALTEFDANLRLRVGQLALGNTTARGVNLDGTLANGVLTMRKLAVADLAGGALSVSGTLDGFAGKPRANVEFEVKADEPAGLLRAAGIVLPLPEEALKPFAADGKLSGSDAAYNVDATVNAGVAALAVKGDVAFPAGAPARLALDLGIQHPNYAGLIRLFDSAFAPEQEPETRAVNLGARLESRAKDYNLSSVSGVFGPLTLDGTVSLALGDGLPRIAAQLNAGDIDTRHFLAAPQPKRPAPRGADAVVERWSSKPVDLDFARAVNGSLALGAKSLRHRQWTIADLKADLAFAGGGVEVKQLNGQLHGGKLALQGRLMPGAPSEALALNYTVSVAGAELGPSLFDAPIDLSGGRFDLELEGASVGSSEAALIAGLNGKGLLTAENTVLKGFDLNRLNARFPFVESPGELVRLIQSALANGTTRVTRLQGDMTMTNGVVGIDDLRIRSPAGDVRALVAADLSQWRLDATVEIRLAGAPKGPPIEMQLSGPLDTPKRDFDSDGLQAYLLEELARQPQRQAPRPPATQVPAPAPQSAVPPQAAPRVPDAAPGAGAGASNAPGRTTPSQTGEPPGTPATRTTDEPRVLQRSPNAPAAANEVPRPPPALPAAPGAGARVLQVSPNAASPGTTGPEPVEPEGQRQPASPSPDDFTREILRGLEP
jgi:uncharacterized protein involved in outer membrane biogenesis